MWQGNRKLWKEKETTASTDRAYSSFARNAKVTQCISFADDQRKISQHTNPHTHTRNQMKINKLQPQPFIHSLTLCSGRIFSVCFSMVFSFFLHFLHSLLSSPVCCFYLFSSMNLLHTLGCSRQVQLVYFIWNFSSIFFFIPPIGKRIFVLSILFEWIFFFLNGFFLLFVDFRKVKIIKRKLGIISKTNKLILNEWFANGQSNIHWNKIFKNHWTALKIHVLQYLFNRTKKSYDSLRLTDLWNKLKTHALQSIVRKKNRTKRLKKKAFERVIKTCWTDDYLKWEKNQANNPEIMLIHFKDHKRIRDCTVYIVCVWKYVCVVCALCKLIWIKCKHIHDIN